MIIGVGCDLAEVGRIRALLERHGARFLRRVYTVQEAQTCLARRDAAPGLAARFAAKEAALKALGTGIAKGITFTEVELVSEGGRPGLRLHGKAQARSRALGVRALHVSISHERTHAMAMVIMEG